MRGVARIWQAALAAILGGATRAGSFAHGDMAGAENAWGASGGHVELELIQSHKAQKPVLRGEVGCACPRWCPAPVVNWRRDITAAGAETGPLLT